MEIKLYKEYLLLGRCNDCILKFGHKDIQNLLRYCSICYCDGCGIILKNNYYIMKPSYIGKEIEFKLYNTAAIIYPRHLIGYTPTGNTTKELVDALLCNNNKIICSKCQGNKQTWDNSLRMMIDCFNCQGTGII